MNFSGHLIPCPRILPKDNESESSKTHDEYFFDLDVVKDEHVFDIDAVKFERSKLLKPEFHGNISFLRIPKTLFRNIFGFSNNRHDKISVIIRMHILDQ